MAHPTVDELARRRVAARRRAAVGDDGQRGVDDRRVTLVEREQRAPHAVGAVAAGRLDTVVEAQDGGRGAAVQHLPAGFDAVGERPERPCGPPLGSRQRMGPQPDPRHDAERALGPEEQLREVGADGGGRRAAGAHDVATRRDDLETDGDVLDLPVPRRVLPAPRQATQPPTVAMSKLCGKWPTLNPCADCSTCSRSGPNVPASTSTTPDSASTSTTPASAVVSSTTPPNTGTEAPHTPLRPPATVSGIPLRLHTLTAAATSAVDVGRTATAAALRHLAGERPVQGERPPVAAALGHLGVVGDDGGRSTQLVDDAGGHVDGARPAGGGAGELDRRRRLRHGVAAVCRPSASSAATRA